MCFISDCVYLNRVSVSRAIKPFAESGRPPDWFSQKVWQNTKSHYCISKVFDQCGEFYHFTFCLVSPFAALCFQVFWAPGNNGGPKVSDFYLEPAVCKKDYITIRYLTFTLRVSARDNALIITIMHLLASGGSVARKVKWWRRWKTWSYGGWPPTGLMNWRSWSKKRRRPTGTQVSLLTPRTDRKASWAESTAPVDCFRRKLRSEAQLIQAGHLDSKLEEIWEEIQR